LERLDARSGPDSDIIEEGRKDIRRQALHVVQDAGLKEKTNHWAKRREKEVEEGINEREEKGKQGRGEMREVRWCGCSKERDSGGG
jgi:hypothetical protein